MEKKTKTHWKMNFNYNYLGSYSLKEGEEAVLTITKVVKEKVKGAKGREEDCTIAYFKESVGGQNKPMILNKTNCKIIQKLYGTPYIEDWANKQIIIYVQDAIEAFGELVDALRIRNLIPTKTKPKLTPDCQKWEKAKEAVKNGATLQSINKHYSITQENFKILCG